MPVCRNQDAIDMDPVHRIFVDYARQFRGWRQDRVAEYRSPKQFRILVENGDYVASSHVQDIEHAQIGPSESVRADEQDVIRVGTGDFVSPLPVSPPFRCNCPGRQHE